MSTRRSKIIFLSMETVQPSSDSSTTSKTSSSVSSKLTSSNAGWIFNSDDADDTLYFPLLRYLTTGCRKRRVENYLDIVESWTDSQFKEHFRLQRTTAYRLIDEVERSAFISHNTFGMKPISGKVSFLLFLWFMANTEPLRTIADRFDISISSTFRIIRRVLTWVLTKLDSVIRWPQTHDEFMAITNGFYGKRSIPGIIGAIDCTHIRIEKPSIDSMSYCNRKKYHSVILQAVADSNMRFMNVSCGEPGSLHDARVFRRSSLYEETTDDEGIFFPNSTFLIGDSAYPSLPWLVPPFRDNGLLTPQEKEFNFLHSSTRMPIEKAFGVLKGRFRRIKFFTEYRNISFITRTIVAACILHNYCIDENDFFDVEEPVNPENVESHMQDNCFEEFGLVRGDRRRLLFQSLFANE